MFTDKMFDIVIVGGGGGGLAAAVSAAEKGIKRILVLEKRGVLGGNSALATGLFAVESPVQQRLGIKTSRDEMFKFAMAYAHWELNARLMRAWLNKSGDTVRWLEEMGVKFIEPIVPLFSGIEYLVYHRIDGGGRAIIKALLKNCESRGVQILLKTAVKKILTGPEGEVVGVLAVNREGKELRIKTRCAIIATGGYAGNKELLKKYYPHFNENLVNIGLPLMGDGIQMALDVGANTEGLGRILGHGPLFADAYPRYKPLWNAAIEPDTIYVNKEGERYTDEDLPLAPLETMNSLNRQPGKIAYCLFDERKKRSLMTVGVIKPAGKNSYPGKRLLELDEHLQTQAKKGNVKISDSWEEIALWMGALPEKLKSTIEKYNNFCAQGYDEDFAKEPKYLLPLVTPPYYAIKLNPALLNTIGGIKTNHHMEVLDLQDKPIPGLYAAGVDTGGWSPETYNIRLTGNAFGFTLNSGRIAAENAGKYINSNDKIE